MSWAVVRCSVTQKRVRDPESLIAPRSPGVHSLIFNAVTPADAGYYKVVVRNSGGEIESEAELYVEPTGGRPLGGTELYNT